MNGQLHDWICFQIVCRWPFGFGQWNLGEPLEKQSRRYRVYLALVPYAGNWSHRDLSERS
jgi:hypothetical protein